MSSINWARVKTSSQMYTAARGDYANNGAFARMELKEPDPKWVKRIKRCLNSSFINQWERDFLHNNLTKVYPTPKQEETLKRIELKVIRYLQNVDNFSHA